MLAIVVVLVHASCAFCTNLVQNGDMQKFTMWDNRNDGIDESNQIQVSTFGEEVMSEGRSPSGHNFGASPCWGDVDGDRFPELVVGDAFGFIWIFKPVSKPKAFPPQFTTGVFIRSYFGNAVSVDIFDYDGDGQNDIIAGTADGAVQVVKNQGGGVFVKQDYTPNYRGIDIHALGRDRKVDLTGRFPLVMHGQYPVFAGLYATPRFADWNRDGKADLIVGQGGYCANALYLYLNTSRSKEADFTDSKRDWLAYGNGREYLAPTVGDLDGDGDLDVLVGERLGYLTWFENKPKSSEPETPFLLDPTEKVTNGHVLVGGNDICAGELPRPFLADVDGDGKLDLFIGRNDGKIMLSHNIGTAKMPVFDTPVFLTGVDTDKPRKVPENVGWGAPCGPNGGNTTFMCIQGWEPSLEAHGTTFYARMCYDYTYLGNAGWMGGGCGNIEYLKEYVLTIRARADKIQGLTLHIEQQNEPYKDEDGLPRQAGGTNVYAHFDPSAQWNTYSKTFRWKYLTKEAEERKLKYSNAHFEFIPVNPKADSWCDITDVSIELASPDNPDDKKEATTNETAKVEKKAEKKTEKKDPKKKTK